MTTTIERLARAIADGLGYSYDDSFVSKGEWNAARGEKGGRYRDINEPMQGDYADAATAVLRALLEPSEGMVRAGKGYHPMAASIFAEMIQAALDEVNGSASFS